MTTNKKRYNKKWRAAHKEHIRQYNRKYYEEHRDPNARRNRRSSSGIPLKKVKVPKSKRRLYARTYRRRHAEFISSYKRGYYRLHHEKMLEYYRRYRDEHPELKERNREYQARYRKSDDGDGAWW